MNTTLIIMAAGIGSRFGEGIKQLAQMGPNGEIIMDYSIHDAKEAGFNKVVFIIRKDIFKEFEEIIGNRIKEQIDVEYVFQELDDLPEGFEVPEGRTKPWGTGQAVLCCKDVVKEPFAIINADDFYGKGSYQTLHDYLADETHKQYALVGYILENTLTDNGSVTRGICQSKDGLLSEVKECAKIEKHDCGVQYFENDEWVDVDAKSLVSMNMWGFYPDFIEKIEEKFHVFLEEKVKENPMKAEFLIPVVVDELIKEGNVDVKLLSSDEKWFGVTYQEDKEAVQKAFAELIKEGVYPANLWG